MVIKIYVVVPDVKATGYNVGLAVKIDELLEWVGRQYVLIHKGTELLPNFTVGFYNLQQGDRLWAVPKNNPADIKRYKLQNCPMDYITDRFILKKVIDTDMETWRQDLRSAKNSASSKKFRKIFRKYEEWADEHDYKPLKITETIYIKPLKPCSDPLPSFWIPQK